MSLITLINFSLSSTVGSMTAVEIGGGPKRGFVGIYRFVEPIRGLGGHFSATRTLKWKNGEANRNLEMSATANLCDSATGNIFIYLHGWLLCSAAADE